MASYTAARSVHKTLAAAAADIVTLTANEQTVEIVNSGSTDPLYVNVGTTAAAPADPTVAGDDTLLVPAAGVRSISVSGATTGVDLVVKLIATSAVPYSVQAGGQ